MKTESEPGTVIGMGPSADYTPFTLNDDRTRGGYARLASESMRGVGAPRVAPPP